MSRLRSTVGLTLTDRATLVGLKVQVMGKSEGLTG